MTKEKFIRFRIETYTPGSLSGWTDYDFKSELPLRLRLQYSRDPSSQATMEEIRSLISKNHPDQFVRIVRDSVRSEVLKISAQ